MRQGSLELWGVNRNLKQGEKQKRWKCFLDFTWFHWILNLMNTLFLPFPGAHWYWPSRLSILLGRYLSASRRPQRVFEGFWNFIQLEFFAKFQVCRIWVASCDTRDFQPCSRRRSPNFRLQLSLLFAACFKTFLFSIAVKPKRSKSTPVKSYCHVGTCWYHLAKC